MAKYYQNEKLLQVTESLFETLKTCEEIANELAEYTYDTKKKSAKDKPSMTRRKPSKKPKRKSKSMKSSNLEK